MKQKNRPELGRIWPLIRKSGSFYLLYLGAMLSLMALLWFFSSSEVDMFKIGFHSAWLIVIVLGCIMVTEQTEAKNQGYRFLRILPLSPKEIIGAKFSLVLAAVTVNVGFNYLLFSLRTGPPDIMVLGRIVMVFCANVALIAAGLVYLLAFRYGMTRLQQMMWISIFLFVLAPIMIYEFILRPRNPDYAKIHEYIISRPLYVWGIMTVIGLLVFWLFMKRAVHLKEKFQ